MSSAEFNLSVTRFYDYLRPFALKLTQNSDQAQDLLQETMAKALANRDKFRDGTNLKAWLFTIMRNTFITHYHRVIKRNTVVDTSDSFQMTTAFADYTTPNNAFNEFLREDLEDAFSNLSYKYKTPFSMYFQGFKYQEIAEILDIPIGTVKNRIHVARKELEGMLHVYR
ncbi:MAG: RNA polymerase sigma factor [Bacteroidota bacterium]